MKQLILPAQDVTTEAQAPQGGDCVDRAVRPFDSAAQMLANLMAERGFQVARGTYHHGNGEKLPTWVIDRPDSPAWNGVWMPLEPNPEIPEDSEAQTLLLLCGMAIEKWDKEAYVFIEPNERITHD